MKISSQKVGEGAWPAMYQLQITVTLGLPVVLQVICRSASRNDTSYEIFDEHGVSMGERCFTYAALCRSMNRPLVMDLNVLLREFGVAIEPAEFEEVANAAASTCEARYGRGRQDGDVVITVK